MSDQSVCPSACFSVQKMRRARKSLSVTMTTAMGQTTIDARSDPARPFAVFMSLSGLVYPFVCVSVFADSVSSCRRTPPPV